MPEQVADHPFRRVLWLLPLVLASGLTSCGESPNDDRSEHLGSRPGRLSRLVAADNHLYWQHDGVLERLDPRGESPVVVASHERLGGVTIDGDSVYWVEGFFDSGQMSPQPEPGPSRLMRTPHDGSRGPEAILETKDIRLGNIVLSDQHVYACTDAEFTLEKPPTPRAPLLKISKEPTDAGGRLPEFLDQVAPRTQCHQFRVVDSDLQAQLWEPRLPARAWFRVVPTIEMAPARRDVVDNLGGQLIYVPTEPDAPEVVLLTDNLLRSWLDDGTWVYYSLSRGNEGSDTCYRGGIYRLPRKGGPSELLTDGQCEPGNLTLAHGFLFWVDSDDSDTLTLKRLPRPSP